MFSILVAVALASQPESPATSSPVAESVKPSLQQIFDEASKAADEGRCEDAIKGFEAIERRPAAVKNDVVRSAIAVRKGRCMVLVRQDLTVETSIRAGIDVLATKGENFALDVRQAYLIVGSLAMLRYDYATGITDFKAALALSKGGLRYQPLQLLVQALAFDKGPEALAYADEALAMLKAETGATKDQIAALQTLHARVLLNQGRAADAYAELKNSLKLQGGLTLRVTANDIITRSDLALAALLVGDRDEARKYLAYTGAGRMKNSKFATSSVMVPPLCGGPEGLKPEDFAVVEFRLNDDGSVSGATPIYTTGGRAVALEFAKAVSSWSWTPEDAKTIPQFFRQLTRIEIRCSVAGETRSLTEPLAREFDRWVSQGNVVGEFYLADEKLTVALAIDAAKKAEASKNSRMVIAMNMWLGSANAVPGTDRDAYLAKAQAMADTISTPPAIRTWIAIRKFQTGSPKINNQRRYREALRTVLSQPAIAADTLSANTLRLLIAAPGYQISAPSDADMLLDAVINDAALPSNNPLKINALLQKAARAAAKGDFQIAQDSFARTGLTEQQCALLGVSPAMKNSGVSSNDFPLEAMAMGFEGWVKLEFNVNADGTTAEQRAVISYPPFVFNKAATGIAKGMRYQKSYRPEGGAACSGKQENLVFRLP